MWLTIVAWDCSLPAYLVYSCCLWLVLKKEVKLRLYWDQNLSICAYLAHALSGYAELVIGGLEHSSGG